MILLLFHGDKVDSSEVIIIYEVKNQKYGDTIDDYW